MLFTFGIRGLEYNWFCKSVFRTCYCGVIFLRGVRVIFSDFTSGEAFNFSSVIRERIFGESSLINIKYFFEDYDAFIEKSLKPKKQTMLHDFIQMNIMEDYEYALIKVGDMVYSDIYRLFDLYKIEYEKECNYVGEDFHEYLLNKIEREALKQVTDEVFNLLFQDRKLLRQFHIECALKTSTLRLSDYSTELKKDGVFVRCTYWPAWLRQGLYRRDKGHCAICQTDLSSLFVNGTNLAIDHIVPLNVGGVNDPTNLQILCQKCNSEKGGDKTTTTGKIANFW